MTYKEETYVLNTLKDIQETIRSPEFKQLIKETHVTNSQQIIDENLNKEQSTINNELYNLIVSLLISDRTDIDSGKAYIDSTDRVVKIKA